MFVDDERTIDRLAEMLFFSMNKVEDRGTEQREKKKKKIFGDESTLINIR